MLDLMPTRKFWSLCGYICLVCFFFQAEDGIRDVAVTGVQTCALPISFRKPRKDILRAHFSPGVSREERLPQCQQDLHVLVRSQEGNSVSDCLTTSDLESAGCL